MKLKNKNNKRLTVIDFFCGGGGFSEGFRRAGFDVIMGVDSWKPAIETHNFNHNLKDKIKDILDFENVEEIEKLPDSDIIIGNNFKIGNTIVLVSNPQTLGEAVSLHEHVHDAVYFEYNFNLTYMLQSRDRIHRLGLQKNQYTRYYYLQTASEPIDSGNAGYIDQLIYKRLKKKEEVMYNAIDNNILKIDFSSNEIEEAIKIIDEERSRIERNRM